MSKVNSRSLAKATDWPMKTMDNDIQTGELGFVPTPQGKNRLWDQDAQAAARFYLDERRTGKTVKVAGKLATLLHAGMKEHSDADQLTIVTIENGFSSIHPSADLDVESGFINGGYMTTAIIIDRRNLLLRMQRDLDVLRNEEREMIDA